MYSVMELGGWAIHYVPLIISIDHFYIQGGCFRRKKVVGYNVKKEIAEFDNLEKLNPSENEADEQKSDKSND